MSEQQRKQPADFRSTLGRYAQLFGTLYAFAEDDLRKMTDEELAEFGAALDAATESNCWFAVYDAAKYLRPLYSGEAYRRERAAEEAADGR